MAERSGQCGEEGGGLSSSSSDEEGSADAEGSSADSDGNGNDAVDGKCDDGLSEYERLRLQ